MQKKKLIKINLQNKKNNNNNIGNKKNCSFLQIYGRHSLDGNIEKGMEVCVRSDGVEHKSPMTDM